MNNWEVRINNDLDKLGYSIYIFRKFEDNIEVLGADGIVTSHKRGKASVNPTLYLDSDMLKPLAEALDNIGIRTDKDAKIEGKFEAQNYHLEDLRRLLKLPK